MLRLPWNITANVFKNVESTKKRNSITLPHTKRRKEKMKKSTKKTNYKEKCWVEGGGNEEHLRTENVF